MEDCLKRGEIDPPWAPGALQREKRVWLMDDSRKTVKLLTSRTRAIQWPFIPNQLAAPAVVDEWTMWEAAIYSNFIFSWPSREIQHLSVSVIAIISYVSFCVLSLNHPKPSWQSLMWMVWEVKFGINSYNFPHHAYSWIIHLSSLKEWHVCDDLC